MSATTTRTVPRPRRGRGEGAGDLSDADDDGLGRETETNDPAADVLGRKRPGRPLGDYRHPVHKFFIYVKAADESTCTIPGCTRGRAIPGHHARNLMEHLRSHHRETHKNVEAEHEKNRAAPKKKKTVPCTSLNGVKMSLPALQVNCLRLVTENALAFRVLDYPAFQDIISPMLKAMPEGAAINSRSIPPKIEKTANLTRQKIIEEVRGKMVSVKVDGCTRQNRHFVGVNIQYTGPDSKPIIRTLAVEELLVAATASNLRTLVEIVLKRFGIRTKQIVSFTTDSGANYVLAGKLLTEAESVEPDYNNYDEWIDATVPMGTPTSNSRGIDVEERRGCYSSIGGFHVDPDISKCNFHVDKR